MDNRRKSTRSARSELPAIVISYVPALLKRPDHLIATLAHELAHYLLATARDSPPCEKEEREFLTDLAAVYLGFGVFLSYFLRIKNGLFHACGSYSAKALCTMRR